jgi:hypothetical protein
MSDDIGRILKASANNVTRSIKADTNNVTRLIKAGTKEAEKNRQLFTATFGKLSQQFSGIDDKLSDVMDTQSVIARQLQNSENYLNSINSTLSNVDNRLTHVGQKIAGVQSELDRQRIEKENLNQLRRILFDFRQIAKKLNAIDDKVVLYIGSTVTLGLMQGYNLSTDNFDEINDKEYFIGTVGEFESQIKSVSLSDENEALEIMYVNSVLQKIEVLKEQFNKSKNFYLKETTPVIQQVLAKDEFEKIESSKKLFSKISYPAALIFGGYLVFNAPPLLAGLVYLVAFGFYANSKSIPTYEGYINKKEQERASYLEGLDKKRTSIVSKYCEDLDGCGFKVSVDEVSISIEELDNYIQDCLFKITEMDSTYKSNHPQLQVIFS